MKNRLFRFAPQESAMALTAMAVALMTFHGQPVQDAKATVHAVRHVSGARSAPIADVTNADFDPFIYRHPIH